MRTFGSTAWAAIYALLGDKDAAFEWLERAYREGAYGILFINVAPEWKTRNTNGWIFMSRIRNEIVFTSDFNS